MPTNPYEPPEWDQSPLPCRRFVPDGHEPYRVVLLDDNDHSVHFVVQILSQTIGYTPEEAIRLALAVDRYGRATVAIAPLAVAEKLRDRIVVADRDPNVPHSHGPMAVLIEPDK